MKKFLFLGLALLCRPLHAQEAAEAVTIPEIRKTIDILSEEIKRLSDAQANTDRQSQVQYKAQLAAIRKAMQEAGDLDSVLAVDAETRRFDGALETGGDVFEEIPEMPAAALVRAPAQLRAAQDAFMRLRQGSLATRKNAVAALTQRFVTRLEDFQREFTRNGQIETALAVRALANTYKAAIENQSVENHTQTLLGAPARQDPGAPALPASRAPWRQWKFLKSGSYSPDGMVFDSPQLPNDMTLEFTPTLGRGRVTGRAQTAPRTINGRPLENFGKFLQWDAGAPQNLNATITLASHQTAQPPAATPAAQVCVMAGETQLASVTVPLSTTPLAFRFITPQDGARTAVYCEQARPQSTTIDIPAGKPVTLLLGFFMKDPGQFCDTSFTVE